MSIGKRSIDKDVKKVIKELMLSIDFDVDALFEAHPEEIKHMILDAVLLSMDEKEIPQIEWIDFIDEEDADNFKNESGEFVNN
ncbi:MAG: hypothetical protein KAS04_05730 [Candidatus Aenigmarchaeota archaeon]|nr:hypothetical protein [Candidatus Aenigmarchaeota archaeon]